MKTLRLIKSKAHFCRRKIVITEINILRNFEENMNIEEKIIREMRKLHSLWFKGTSKDMHTTELLRKLA